MEFLLWTFVLLMLLGLASVALVEGGYRIAHIWSRCSYWLRYQYPLWRSGRQVRSLKARYGPRKDRSPSPFGALRFTKSRSVQFGQEPPDIHGGD